MHYSPHTNLAIARERHADLLREARQRELAHLVADERPGVLSRLRSRIRSERRRHAVARPA